MKSYDTEPRDQETATTSPQQDADVRVNIVDVEAEDVPVSAEDVRPPLLHRFFPPDRGRILNELPFWGVVLLGAILRFWQLGEKPLHHDESLHAYFSLQLMHNLENWAGCLNPYASCYRYDPLLHGPFQFHAIALVYKISELLGVYDYGVNTVTVRIAAALLGTVIVGLPYFLRDYLGKVGAWLACFLLAISPSMVYFSRFAREDIYMACFTLLLVVAVGRYVRDRRMHWLVIAAVAFSLSYATKEATFLTIAVFGSFFAALMVWEVGLRWQWHNADHLPLGRFMPRTGAPFALLLFACVAAPLAKVFFAWMKNLSLYITDPKNTAVANAYVQGLKDRTVAIVPWIGIILGLYVLSILIREMFGRLPLPGQNAIADRLDPQRQPLLDTVFTMPWTHWFFALLSGWTIFLVLFTVVFTNIRGGIGDGIWQGLYYWLQQQQVARGDQPWYYYLLLIPLYEQIGVVFGIVGVVRCLLHPTRFRLFLVYWLVGNMFIYSWAAEKMPWLMIHMTMPMMLVAAIGLEPAVVKVIQIIRSQPAFVRLSARVTGLFKGHDSIEEEQAVGLVLAREAQHFPRKVLVGSIVTTVAAFLLLLPTLQNMYQVTYVHYADGPHEMMIYVQTTTDVNIVMDRVERLDNMLYGGKHMLPIGVTDDATWPFAWYLRDYHGVCFQYPTGCGDRASTIPVIITGDDNLASSEIQYGPAYNFHVYNMRTWWDEGYKPPPCIPTSSNSCQGEATWGGVGPWLWLSYGDTPPPHATFNPGLAMQHVWQWWWQRRAIGGTQGTYRMGLFIRKGAGVNP